MQIEISKRTTKYGTTIESQKLYLMDEIIKFFSPLFNAEIDRKKTLLMSNKKDYLKLKREIEQFDTSIKNLGQKYEREKIVQEILEEISCLIDHDVLYGSYKQIVQTIVSSIDSSGIEELQKQLDRIRVIARKSIAKVIPT